MNEYQFLQEQAYTYLRERILNDELEQQRVYSETQVARELNCSRTPVKDALTRLSHAKYIDIIPSKGFQLHKLTEDDLINTFQTRVAVESFCVISLMQQRDTPRGAETLAHLRGLLSLQERLADGSDISAFLASDIEFHRSIMHYVTNSDFAELYELHAYRIEAPARRSLRAPDRCREAWQEHAGILDAMHSGDIGRCYLAVLRHNESTYAHGVRLLQSKESADAH